LLGQTEVSFGLHRLQYIDFDNQEYDSAFHQLRSELWRLGVKFKMAFGPGESFQLPQQPPLQPRAEQGMLTLIKPPLLQSRTEYNRSEDMIANAQHELWISGISLSRMSQHRVQFTTLLRRPEKVRVRFMMIDPRSRTVVRETSAYVGQREAVLRRRLEVCLDDLCELRRAYPAQVQIRTTSHRPSVGYFVSDPDTEDGVMTVSPYFYQIDRLRGGDHDDPCCDPPFLHLPAKTQRQWFEVYRQDFERMWEKAEE